MDRFANLSDEGLMVSLFLSVSPMENPFIPGMEIPRVSPHGHVPELFSMAKPHVKELWMFVFGLGESPAEVGNGMPEHKHKRS